MRAPIGNIAAFLNYIQCHKLKLIHTAISVRTFGVGKIKVHNLRLSPTKLWTV